MSNLVINANSIYDRVIRIGRQTENLVSSITFNLNMWIEEYGAGECVLNVRRNGDGSAYPVPMTIADGMTTWTITDTDTAKKGRGEIQLVYRAGDKVKTSPIFTISCGESLVGGEVPGPYEEWLTELNRMTAEVEAAKTSASASAQTAQTAAVTAAEKATEAEQSANTASGFAVNASASATSASTSAQAAAQSAGQAASSVADVKASAQAASASAQSAEVAKTAAQTAEASAQGFAQTASAKAAEAAESAVQAQESVTDAQAEVTRASAEADRAKAEAEQAASRIYDFLPTDSASGAVASFADGADNVPLKSLVVGINPVQDLHGYSSPWPAGGGKNLLDPSLLKDQSAWNIIPIYAPVGTVLTMSTNQETASTSGLITFFRYPDGTQGTGDNVYNGRSVTKTVGEEGYLEVVQRNRDNVSSCADWRYQIEVGSTATDWTPYENICPISGWTGMTVNANGTEIPISWESEAGTVYGGTIDVVSGLLTVDRVKETFVFNNPTEDNTYNLESQRFNLTKRSTASSNSTGKITNVCGAYAYAQANWNNGEPHFYVDATSYILYLTKNTYRGENVELCYPLETPLTYQLTPTEVKSLLGTNNIYANTGDTSVEYHADIKTYINRKIAEAIAALS